MSNTAARPDKEIRYEPNERPPPVLSFGLGFQQAILSIGGVVLIPVIVIRAAGESDLYMTWADFAARLSLRRRIITPTVAGTVTLSLLATATDARSSR